MFWEDNMIKHLALAVLTAASLAGSVGVASAQPWVGGYYDDDRGPYYRHRYRERDYYDRDRYDRRRDYHERRGYRTQSGCRPGFTVQDGVCKPYTGR
jgi:hypothetical protein